MDRDSQATQWIAGLHFPSQAAKVLVQEKFWTPECLARYLGAAAEFAARQPKEGREVVQVGVQLAQLVPRCERQHQLLIHSLALLAWTHQSCGAGAQGEGIYRNALELASHAPLDPRVSGDLLRRYASLRRLRGDMEGALQAADQAVELLRAPQAFSPPHDFDWQLELGRALTERARVLWTMRLPDEAVAEIGLALEAFDPFRHDLDVAACLQILGRIADSTRALDRLHRVARRVALLRDAVELHHLTPGSAVAQLAAGILHLDGRLFQRMGALQRAERSLRHARRLLRGQSGDTQLIAVSLDLARLLVGEDRQTELRRLSADTLEHLADRGGLSLTRYRWRRALASGRLDAAELRRIRQAFQEERDASDESREQLAPEATDHRPGTRLRDAATGPRKFGHRRLA